MGYLPPERPVTLRGKIIRERSRFYRRRRRSSPFGLDLLWWFFLIIVSSGAI